MGGVVCYFYLDDIITFTACVIKVPPQRKIRTIYSLLDLLKEKGEFTAPSTQCY